jgi:hypothetical protein
VVGATPGGELGGTWAAPTVDADHSGSTHAGIIAAHTAVSDPHPLYRREDLNHSHASSGLEGGVLATYSQSGHTHAAAYAPIGVNYLVGTADATLTSEIAVGTTPGGELGGTWASPTVDATHSGSTHAATQSAAESTAATALTNHAAAADPHTGYRLESADHSHASTGLQGGLVAHSVLTYAGLTTGHVLTATSATAAAFAAPTGGGGTVSRMNIPQTPTVSTSPAYTSGDAIGGLLTFANAAAATGGSGLILSATALCKTPALLPILELWLFNQTFTPTSDNAAFAPSDADMANCIGVIPIAAWYDDTANSLAVWRGAHPYVLTGTSLFGQLVVRTAVTLGSTTDLIVAVNVTRD